MTISLYGWGPMFGLRSPSPYVMKSDIQLQMLGLEFARKIPDLETVPKHKAPYVRDGELLVQDSTFIRAHFEQKLGKDLDAGLSAEQRAVAWSVERLLEDRLHLIMLHERWAEDDNFARGPGQFFAPIPEPMRAAITQKAQDEVKAMLHRHGIGRHSRDERMSLAERDIAAVSTLLGDKTFLFGDEPSAVDAAAYGELASASTPFFDSRLPGIVDGHANLRSYLARMDQRYFAHAGWTAAA